MEMLSYSIVLVLAFFGLPIFVVMGGIALLAFYFAQIDLSAVAIDIYKIAGQSTLLTIPLFTFAGYVIARSKSPERLLNLARSTLGWLPGGIAIMSLVLCAFFTAFTGASGVTIIALGGLIYPILMEEGYSESFSLGLITASGSLGLLFAPSLPLLLYGIVAKVNIDTLFISALIPGLILILGLASYSFLLPLCTEKKLIRRHPFSFDAFLTSIKEARWEIPLPFIVLGGIYGGLVTPSEAAAVTAFYALFIECILYRDLNFFRDVPNIATESMNLVGAILLILCCALGLTNYLVDEQIPMKLLDFIQGFITNKWLFLLCLNIFLLIVGCLMDIFSAVIVVLPLIIPIAKSYGIDPVHLAIIFLTNLEIGYLTPPVGLNLFISSFMFKKSIPTLYRASLPFLLVMLFILLMFTYLPGLFLLPH